MIIASAHLQMMSNQCTDFQKNPCTHLLDHRGQNHVHRRVTDGQTDGQGETNIPPPPHTDIHFVCNAILSQSIKW